MKYLISHLYIIGIILLSLSCGETTHTGEKGVAVLLNMPNNDTINDIRLWVFDAQGILAAEYHYSTPAQLASTLQPYPAGKYTFVVGTNIVSPFSTNTKIGTTQLTDFLITLDNASASPQHAHYGTQTATVSDDGITLVPISLSRVLSEFQLTIKDVPAEVISASAQVINCADGFYPAVNKLTHGTSIADLGTATPSSNVISFPLIRIMPVVGSNNSSDESTQIVIQFKYINGGTINIIIQAPNLQNGGTYTPQIEYSILRPGITVQITSINGWVAVPPIEGEILNYDK